MRGLFMTGPERTAHSLAEVHLYAAMVACRACSTLGLIVTDVHAAPDKERCYLHVDAQCEACGERGAFDFVTDGDADLRPEAVCRIPVILNTTREPSDLLDAGQWLTLYRMAVEAAERISEKLFARAVLIEAGQCLAEALRFYPADSDVPAASAFFSAETLQRFRDHPHLYARQRLIELAARLPTSVLSPPPPVSAERPAVTRWWLR